MEHPTKMSYEQKGWDLLGKVSESYSKQDFHQAIIYADEFISNFNSEYSDIYVIRASCNRFLNKKNNALKDYYRAWHRKVSDYYREEVEKNINELSSLTLPIKNIRTIDDKGQGLMITKSDPRIGKTGYDLNDSPLWITICGLKYAEKCLNQNSRFAEISELNPIWDMLDSFYEINPDKTRHSTVLIGFDNDHFFVVDQTPKKVFNAILTFEYESGKKIDTVSYDYGKRLTQKKEETQSRKNELARKQRYYENHKKRLKRNQKSYYKKHSQEIRAKNQIRYLIKKNGVARQYQLTPELNTIDGDTTFQEFRHARMTKSERTSELY